MPPSDLDGLAFWWDNVVHLKAMLQTLGSGAFASAVSRMGGAGGGGVTTGEGKEAWPR